MRSAWIGRFALILIQFTGFSAIAAESAVQVILTDPALDPQGLDLRPGQFRKQKAPGVPGKSMRDKVFTDADVTEEVSGFSEKQKDEIYSAAGLFPVDRLCESFPKISREKLTQLRIAVLKAKGTGSGK